MFRRTDGRGTARWRARTRHTANRLVGHPPDELLGPRQAFEWSSRSRGEGEVYLAFEECTFDAFRTYYECVPKGKGIVEYTLRLNNAGEVQLPETRVEALVVPEIFGALPHRLFVAGQ